MNKTSKKCQFCAMHRQNPEMQSCVTPPFPCSACSVRGLVCRTVDQDVAANDPFYLPHPEALAPSSVSWSASSDLLNSRHAVASIANEGSYRPSLVPPPGLVRLQHRFSTDFGGRYVKKVWGKLFQKWDALPDKAYSSHVPTLTSVPPLIDSGEPSVSTKRDRWERDPMPSFSPDPFFNANLVRTQLTTGSPSQDTAYEQTRLALPCSELLDAIHEEASHIYSTAPPTVIIRDPPPRRRVAGEEQLIYEGRNFQTANGHALVALGILAQEILREEISQEKGLTLTPAQAQLGPQWTDVVDPNGTTHPSKIIPEKRKRTSKGARQEDNESDASAEGPSVEETRSTLSVNDAVSDESDVF